MYRLRQDEVYTEPYEDTEEERLRAKWGTDRIQRYRLRTVRCRDLIEAEIFPIWDGKTKRKVKETYARTTEKEREIYERRQRKNLRRMISSNFSKNDSWITGTFSDARLPATIEKAQAEIVNYIRRVKYHAKKRGYSPLKYVYAIEFFAADGEPVRCNVHIVFNVSDRDFLEELWKGGGRTQARRLQPDDYGLTGMANYIIKADNPRKNRKESKKKAYGYSLNLEKPDVIDADSKITKRKARKMADDSIYAETTLKKLYPRFRLLDMEVYHNELIDGYYILARFHDDDFKDECSRPKPPPERRKNDKRKIKKR